MPLIPKYSELRNKKCFSLRNYILRCFIELFCISIERESIAYFVVTRYLEIDGNGKLMIKFYDRGDEFSFRIVNFPFICGNIPSAAGVFTSQPHVMPELVETTLTFCTVLDFLQLGFWNRVMLLQN